MGALLALLTVSCGSAEKGTPKPQAPDMRAVVAEFKAPTGTIDKQAVASILQGLLTSGKTLRSVALHGQLSPLLHSVAAASAAEERRTKSADPDVTAEGGPGRSSQAFGVNGGGWVEVTRICNGWGAAPTPDVANGVLKVNAGFTETGLDPVAWGSASKCRYLAAVASESHRVEIDASAPGSRMWIYLGDAISFSGIELGSPIVSLAGKVTVDDVAVDLQLDLRIDPRTGLVEFLIPIGNGSIAASLTTDAEFTLRAANGVFRCDLGPRTCKTGAGVEVGF